MKKKTITIVSIFLLILFNLLLKPINVYAIDSSNDMPTTNNQEEIDLEDNQDNESNEKSNEEHQVSVITTKVDEEGNPLKGATLQILDLEGNILDEWISDGTEHNTMLSEGNYILHEKEAPAGYKIAEDKEFTVSVILKDLTAITEHDNNPEVCEHHLGVALYYIESEGVRQEVYCINQGWGEPKIVENYDGVILTEDNIKTFAPDSDPNISNKELYNKVLDIVYHRSKVNEVFPDLTETEIRFITEFALKNYTSAMVDDGTLFRRYKYDASAKRKFVEDLGNGSAIGQLAKHWWYYHHTTIPDKYVDLYNYLIRDDDFHPEDMHLYIYSTKNQTADGEKYQNLVGITWFNPYDDDNIVYLTLENEYSDETIDININKVWDDSNNEYNTRPNEIEINLYADDNLIETYTIKESENWELAINNLPKYSNGKIIKYSIIESEISLYSTIYEENEYNFKIINKFELGKGGDVEEMPPQTGINDNNRIDKKIIFKLLLNILLLPIILKKYV